MAPLTKPFPSPERFIVNWLPSILAGQLVFPVRVLTIIPLPVTATVCRVTRAAGAARSLAVDHPIVDMDVFSPVADEAETAARLIEAIFMSVLAGVKTADGTVQAATTVIGPHWLPDINPNLTRYSASYELRTHA